MSVNIGEPAVVAAADGDLPDRLLGDLLDEHGRVEHLDIDAELVHMLEPRRDIFHLASFLRRAHDPAGALSHVVHFLGGHDDAYQAANFAIDEPILGAAATARLDDHRPVLLVGFVHIVPGPFALDHMGVGIYSRHVRSLRRLLTASSAPLAPLSTQERGII